MAQKLSWENKATEVLTHEVSYDFVFLYIRHLAITDITIVGDYITSVNQKVILSILLCCSIISVVEVSGMAVQIEYFC